jgi:hypothetical protein
MRRRERRVAGWLGLAAFLAYLPFFHGHFTGTDETGVYLTARALYETGSFEVHEGPHRFVGRDGRTYAHFAPGLPLLAVPLYALGDLAAHTLPATWLARVNPRPEEPGRIDTLVTPPLFAVALYAPLASAVLVAVFFLFQSRLGVSRRNAILASTLLGATSYVATHSVYFLRHTSEAITLLAAFHALFAYRQQGRLRDLTLGSLWASLTLLVAVPALVGLLPIALYGLFLLGPRLRGAPLAGRARILACAALPALVVLAAHVALNYQLWGTFLDSPMLAQRGRFSTPLLVGLSGFLWSPGCSVFVYSPLLLLLPWTLPPFWRAHRAECAVAVGVALCLLPFCARFELWPGLWSAPGPRYLFVLTPVLLLPLGCWLDLPRGKAKRVLLWGLAGLGLGVQLVLVLARWTEVIRGMEYKKAVLDSGFDFLFVPEQSPVIGSWRALQAGHVDAWLFGLVSGSELSAGAPLAAAALLGAWAIVFLLVLTRLRRALRPA